MNDKVYDMTIIGGGPIGIFSAFCAGMRQSSVKIIESLPTIGGQLSALYPEKYIYDMPGFTKITAKDLVSNLKNQMEQFSPTVCLEESVQEVNKREDNVFILQTNKGLHYSKSIIITSGKGEFQPRTLNIDTEKKDYNKNIHYFVKNMNEFKDKQIVIVGGGDSAVDWALMLEPICKSVSIVHRRDKFRAHENSVKKLIDSNVNILTPYTLIQLIGDNSLSKVVIEHTKTKETKNIEADEIIVNYGFISSPGSIKNWGLSFEKNCIVVNSKMETNMDGIYAAGDICYYEGKLKQLVTGVGESQVAINSAKKYIELNYQN